MSQEQPKGTSPTNDELLADADRFLTWARNNYRNQYATPEQVNNLAMISLAASGLVIARSLAEQTAMMREIGLPGMPIQGGDNLTGAGGDAL